MSKLLEVVLELVEAAGEHEAFTMAEEFSLLLEQAPYMPLVIESWAARTPYLGEKRRISVAHYIQQIGVAIPDPDVLMTDQGVPIEIQQVLGNTRVLSHGKPPFQTVIDENARDDVERFMDTWAQTIRDQGWLEVAAKRKGGNA